MMAFQFIGIEQEIYKNLHGICKHFDSLIFKSFERFQIYIKPKMTLAPSTQFFINLKWGSEQ